MRMITFEVNKDIVIGTSPRKHDQLEIKIDAASITLSDDDLDHYLSIHFDQVLDVMLRDRLAWIGGLKS